MFLFTEEERDWRSPISLLYEKFSRSEMRPSFTFSAYHNPLSCQGNGLIWQCTVEVPNHEYGYGSSYSKKNAKSKACLDFLVKLGHDVTKLSYLDQPSIEELPKVKTEPADTELPLSCSCDGPIKSESYLNSTSHLSPQPIRPHCLSRQIPETEMEPRFSRLCSIAISSEVRNNHGIAREQNPRGYLEILCRKADCENPTFEIKVDGFAFVTTANLGPWTASGSASNKKHSKYLATSSLITIIEDFGKLN